MRINRLALPSVLLLSLGLASCTQPQSPPQDPRAEAFAKLPNWQGIWVEEKKNAFGGIAALNTNPDPMSVFNMFTLMSLGTPWNDEGRARFAALISTMGNRKAEGWGFPMMMDSPAQL